MAAREFQQRGDDIRTQAKQLVLEYLHSVFDAAPGRSGVTQASVSRECGFDWGDFEKATSSSQQYWTVALLNQLRKEGSVEQVDKKWRLTKVRG